MIREYIGKLKENPIIIEYFCKRFLPVLLIGATAVTSANLLRNSDFLTEYRAKRQEQREFVEDVRSRLNDETVYTPISDNVLSVDLEGDGDVDAYIGFVGARPGAIHIRSARGLTQEGGEK